MESEKRMFRVDNVKLFGNYSETSSKTTGSKYIFFCFRNSSLKLRKLLVLGDYEENGKFFGILHYSEGILIYFSNPFVQAEEMIFWGFFGMLQKKEIFL